MIYNKKTIPIRTLIIIVFMVAMVLTISGIGYVIFSSWLSSAKLVTKNIEEVMHDSLFSKIDSFLDVPAQINETNQNVISRGILDVSDVEHREQFFSGALSSHNTAIYSFSYGTVNGEYYGARRNESGAIEIMRNDASTDGNSWYYSVNEDLTAGELAVQAGKFDPRTRPWYKAAVSEGATTFSPIYKHFVMNDLTISSACPIYTMDGKLQGVLGTHMLLRDIGGYLEDAVQKYNGYAVILEKSSSELIANSMGINNFTVQDGILDRYGIEEINNTAIQGAYEQYTLHPEPNFLYEGKDQKYYISVKEIEKSGLDLVVISAIPEELMIAPVLRSISIAVWLVVLSLVLSFVIYLIVTRKLFNPVENLMQATDAMALGDLTRRVDIVRNDEIGLISGTFNKLADKMQFLINNLETTVQDRSEELHKANSELEEKRDQLRLLLDSAAEAIYGVDENENCTFCNSSCITMLGYTDQAELLGKNMHFQIHHSRSDGTPIPIEECKIFRALSTGRGVQIDDEVFWKSDGTFFDVEYSSYPQIRNGEVIGAVVTFSDIRSRKENEAKIQYVLSHDILTGLQNRRGFEDNRSIIDIPANLPLSVIFADTNGLKMTNDIFGHSAGDELIKKSAEILKRSCREDNLIARVGGDEFILLLPKTDKADAMKVLALIRTEFSASRVAAVKCSASLGLDTKISPNQSLDEIIANAENLMYKNKTINRKTINKGMIDTLVETLFSRSSNAKTHSIAVSGLCSEMGYALHLSETEINKLGRIGYLHDIGKIVLDESIITKNSLTIEELEKIQQHPMVGYRILNLFDDTLDLAEYVYSHHERWDGTGYPQGLKNGNIPLISRIVSIAETYDYVLNRGELPLEERIQEALEVITEGAGTQFDPELAAFFVQMMGKKKY